jgi:fermentation-respiration switch protein FrsA (DUF1100 family)
VAHVCVWVTLADIGYRLPNAIQLYRKVGVNVVLVDYRGFGHSEGEPSEQGLKLDAEVVRRVRIPTALLLATC